MMKGSNVNNIKLDPVKQKIVECDVCGASLVVGKFAKKNQTCIIANQFPSNSKCKPSNIKKNSSAKEKMVVAKNVSNVVRKVKPKQESKQELEPKSKQKVKNTSFGEEYVKLMNQLDFDIDKQRRFKKRYAIDGGGVVVVYPNIEHQVDGGKPRLDWFSVITQRAVGINEDFRKFMPPDAASDCELIASEVGDQIITRPDIGTVRCDECGSLTDEFGVDPNKNKVLCIKPNGCFRKSFTNAGAEAVE